MAINGCHVTATILLGDDPWSNPDEVLSVSNVIAPEVLGDQRMWRYAVRSFGQRMREQVTKSDLYMNAFARHG